MISDTLISLPYLREQVILHARSGGYGGKGGKWAPAVADAIRSFECQSVLDYGCGQGQLVELLRGGDPLTRHLVGVRSGVRVDAYDPAVKGRDLSPEPADLVVCTDVLEHIEPERLSTVLAHLKSLTRVALFVVIATRPSNKTLTDGRNAHLIIQPGEWWAAQLQLAGFRETGYAIPHPLDKPSREWKAVLAPC